MRSVLNGVGKWRRYWKCLVFSLLVPLESKNNIQFLQLLKMEFSSLFCKFCERRGPPFQLTGI
jgi:hypothetical protein